MPRPSARPALLSTTANDETFLLGTREQLVALAQRILDQAAAETESSCWEGITVTQPHCSPSLTDPMSDLAISGVVVVRSESDRRTLMNKLRINDGLDPIDWEAYDQNYC